MSALVKDKLTEIFPDVKVIEDKSKLDKLEQFDLYITSVGKEERPEF